MSSAKPIDWSQLWYPGPRRAFTAEEMARAGHEAPSRTLIMGVLFNIATVLAVFLQAAPAEQLVRLAGLALVFVVAGFAAARWLWWRPWRWPLMQACLALVAGMIATAFTVRALVPAREERAWIAALLAGGTALLTVVLWFLVVWRAQKIEARLAEQAERERAIEMARRLAAAQLEPHFLFNTLASLQHWVQTKDDRAAPLLQALVGYLRATLPLFDRPLLALGEEVRAAEHYLRVMQLRLGERLTWHIDIEPALATLPLPPGLVLTLVENAVEHGVEPQLAGGEVRLAATRAGAEAVVAVQDNGAGLTAGAREGLGLTNIRERLALTHGTAARLVLAPAAGGGCRAELRVPLATMAAGAATAARVAPAAPAAPVASITSSKSAA